MKKKTFGEWIMVYGWAIIAGLICVIILSSFVSAQDPYVFELQEKKGLAKFFSQIRPFGFFDVCSKDIGYSLIQFKNDGTTPTYWIQDYCSGGAELTVWRGSPYDGTYPSHPSSNREKVATENIYPNNGFTWGCDAGAYWNYDCYYDIVCCEEQTCTQKSICPHERTCHLEDGRYYYCSTTDNNKRFYAIQQTDCSLETSGSFCPSGEFCDNGKCIKETTCSDSDGKNYKVKGTVTTTYLGGSPKIWSDSCVSGIELFEKICVNDWIATERINCKDEFGDGYECKDGRCVLGEISYQSSCTDSDNGKNIDVKGKVSGKFANGNTYTNFDYCSVTDRSRVSEGTCVDTNGDGIKESPNSEWINCQSGTICIDGACITETSETTCSNQGGICEDLCSEGRISIGFLDCGEGLCCKKGVVIGECFEGTTRPYCSDLIAENEYFICEGGITFTKQCKGDYKCSDGILCYGLDRGEPGIVKSIGDFFEGIREGIFGGENSCKDCQAFAVSTLIGPFFKSYSCERRLLPYPQTITTCGFSFIKLFLVPIVLILVTLFANNLFRTSKKLRIKNKKIAFLISLILGIILAWITFLLFTFGIIIFIIYIIVVILLKMFLPTIPSK